MAATARDLTAEERDTALLVLAAYGGNAAAASRALKEQGNPVPERTLRNWRNTARYRELAEEHGREIEQVSRTADARLRHSGRRGRACSA